jgi:peroxiredoxin
MEPGTSIQTGERAPTFALPHRPGETIDLSDHLGREKVVLLFIPLAFSSVCTTELRTVRDSWEGWQDLDASVFAISVDSPFVTAHFRDLEDFPFLVLSDFNKDVSGAYGVLAEHLAGLKGVAKRSVFVIGSDGRVAYVWVSEDAGVEPDYEAVRQAVAAAS